jgi:hypothetical protein
MQPGSRRLRVDRMETLLNPPQLARDLWMRATAPLKKGSRRTHGEASEFVGLMNHRFDKLGNPLPLELHGCGCGLCARRQRAALKWGSSRSQGEASDFVGNLWEAR